MSVKINTNISFYCLHWEERLRPSPTPVHDPGWVTAWPCIDVPPMTSAARPPNNFLCRFFYLLFLLDFSSRWRKKKKMMIIPQFSCLWCRVQSTSGAHYSQSVWHLLSITAVLHNIVISSVRFTELSSQPCCSGCWWWSNSIPRQRLSVPGVQYARVA